MIESNFRELAAAHRDEIISVRRHLHQYPELGFRERLTSAFVADALTRLGLSVRQGVADTGVVALLETGRPGPCLAVRADMDALPLTEATGLPFASRHDGVMHACGHDGHMAMVLGAARMLTAAREELCGTVKFIFQPAEEMLGGARHMVEAGVLESPRVDGIVGLHLWPDLATGRFGVRPGTVMASMDHVDITVHGKAGHGAAPHQGVDAILAAAHVLAALQALVSRESDPVEPVVLSMGSIRGGSLPNIIADRVEIRGTVRAVSSAAREHMQRRIAALAEAVAGGLNARAEVAYELGYPPTVNDPGLIRRAEACLLNLFGQEAVVPLDRSPMTSEDMAFYMEQVPGAFLLVGAKGAGEGNYPLHHPQMTIDERALEYGAAFLAEFARDFLRTR